MDKKKKEIIIVGILILVFFIIFFMSIKKKPSLSKKAGPLTGEMKSLPESIPAKSVKASKDIVLLQRERAQLPWGRDPFSFTKIRKVSKGRALILKGISLGKDGRGYAFINDEIVTVGEVVSGYKVMEVKRDKVLLKKGVGSFYLGMPEE